MNRKWILLLLIVLMFIKPKAGEVPVRTINKKIETLIYKNTFSEGSDIYSTEKQLSKLAKDNNELSNAYYCYADVLLKNADYSDAVFMFKKVDSLTVITGNGDDRIMANLFLATIYNKLALKKQSDDYFAIAERLIAKLNIPDATMQLVDQKSLFLEENLKWCDALPVKKSLVSYFENKVREGKEERYKTNLAIIFTQLAYITLKCNNDVVQAKSYIKQYEEIFSHYPAEYNNMIPQYYIDKGIISAEDNDMEKARYWFTLADSSAGSRKLESYRLRSMEEQIRYGLLDDVNKKIYFDAYLRKKANISKHAEKIIAYEQKMQADRQAEKIGKNTLVIFIISISAITVGLIYHRVKQERLKRHFNKIIENIQKEREMLERQNLSSPTGQVGTSTENGLSPDSKTDTARIMSEEKERELLKKIEEFEKTEAFNDEKFTMAKFVLVLESNAKYINHVLQKYKGNTFSDYLNELRIKCIVNKLIEQPDHLHFKISYLAKISGFTTHSRFAHVFKTCVGMSPSEFISQVTKQNERKKAKDKAIQ